jgi:hypothetical protein
VAVVAELVEASLSKSACRSQLVEALVFSICTGLACFNLLTIETKKAGKACKNRYSLGQA